MKVLHIDCSMGAAGDMLTAALLELLPEKDRRSFIDAFNSAGIPGVVMTAEPSVKCGVSGTRVHMKIDGEEEGDHHEHSAHEHSHRGMAEIESIIESLAISAEIREDIMNVYSVIADAESKAHGVPVIEVHFHEVGALDAIADVTAVSMLMALIGPERVMASPVNVGGGTVMSAHGVLPVPAPATANILEGIPSYSGDIKSELCTPTGAALLRYYVTEFCNMPPIVTEATGRGMGKKDFDKANCVTVTLGRTEQTAIKN